MICTIGERLNGSREKVAAALQEKNIEFVGEETRRQLAGGALMIDINGGTSPEQEQENLIWLAEHVALACDAPVCIDSANPEIVQAAIDACLKARSTSVPASFEIRPGLPWLVVNSITGDDKRYDLLLPVIDKYNCAVVALCLGGGDIRAGVETRIKTGTELVERLVGDGIKLERIYLDPLVMPIGIDTKNGLEAIEVVKELKARFPGLRSVCGLSNISFGLPARALLNRTFLVLLLAAGLDAAVMDTSDRKLMNSLRAALALCGEDMYCSEYISAFRENKLRE